jgi:hypothetical protein
MEPLKRNQWMAKHIFVLGLDDFNLSIMQSVDYEEELIFHDLLSYEEIRDREDFPVREFLAKSRRILQGARPKPDGIVGYWDFPVTEIVPILCREQELPSSAEASVLKCVHKYWSRKEQRKVIPECTPAFQRVDPFAEDCADTIELDYPYWLKPVKSFHSYLSFSIANREQLEQALRKLREEIHRLQEPFEHLLSLAAVPEEIARGGFCLVEEAISGRQCTVSGYVHANRAVVYGVVDSLTYPDVPSFSRFQYPSALPDGVKKRMTDLSRRFVEHLEYSHGPFNIEFFYQEEGDRLWLLEMNPRISQSHSVVYRLVDGQSNHRVMIDLALGRKPRFPQGQGRFRVAAKCFFRSFEDGVVARVPGAEELERAREIVPEAVFRIDVRQGDRLSELRNQDSFSYELGFVFLGGRDEQEITDKFHEIEDVLGFEVEERLCAR